MAQTAEVQLKTVAQTSGTTSRIYNPGDATSAKTDSDFCYVRGTKNRCGINYNLAPIADIPAGATITGVHLRYKMIVNGTIERMIKLYSDASHTSYAAADAYAYNSKTYQTSTNNSTTQTTEDMTLTSSNASNIINALNSDHSFFTTEGKFVIGFNITNNSSSTSTTYRQCLYYCYVYLIYTLPQYTITTSTDGHGSISSGGTYESGTPLTITAVPNESYKFSHFTITDDSTQYTSNPLSISVDRTKTITAHFTPKSVNISSVEVVYTAPLLVGEGAVVRCAISET